MTVYGFIPFIQSLRRAVLYGFVPLACALVAPVCALGQAAAPSNGSWRTSIPGHAAVPPRFVAVDKKQQQLFVFEHNSPVRLKSTFVCSTGQAIGDKQTSGDMRTPEGIYFVVQHLTAGLDHFLYGNEAYTLNYPNPVDKARGKTGSGIWIHGRGEAISPLQTHGCVVVNNNDLTALGPSLSSGTPVLLADSVAKANAPAAGDAQTADALTKRVQAWAKAWGQRSASLFDFYDADAYARAQGEPFASFRDQKERLFKSLAWIKTTVRDIRVLEGPGYWVTWFYQDYSAPNLSSKGVRRLYWERDNKGEYRILGMEWDPGATLAPAPALMTASASSEERTIPSPESQVPAPAERATQADAPRQDVAAAPSREDANACMVNGTPAPVAAPPAKPVAARPPLPPSQAGQALPEKPAATAPAAAPQEDPSAALAKRVEAWRQTWEKGDLNAYMDFYAEDAVQGDRQGARSIRQQKRDLWSKRAPVSVRLSDICITTQGDTARAQMRQQYKAAGENGDTGLKTLYFRKVKGDWRITREDWGKVQEASSVRQDNPQPGTANTAATGGTASVPKAEVSAPAAPSAKPDVPADVAQDPVSPAKTAQAGAPAARQETSPQTLGKTSPAHIENFQAKPDAQRLLIRYDLISPAQRQITGRAAYTLIFANGARRDIEVSSGNDSRFDISRRKVMEGSARLPQGQDIQTVRAIGVTLTMKDKTSYYGEYPLTR